MACQSKIRYDSFEAARHALAKALLRRFRGDEQRRERRIYKCPDPACNGWHLTSTQ